ncbi:hypothetical protein K4G97_23515, partial [Mycobacterium tuberculosis]|nr:hypothetical protein [Mycobacterium tuberculosis]
MAITHAKIGRSIKNFAMKQAPCYCALEAAAALAGAAPDAAAPEAAAAPEPAAAGAAVAAAPDAAPAAGASCAGTDFTVAPGRTFS